MTSALLNPLSDKYIHSFNTASRYGLRRSLQRADGRFDTILCFDGVVLLPLYDRQSANQTRKPSAKPLGS
jgi:hypothetical protein